MRRTISVAVLMLGLTAIVMAQTSMTPAMQNAPARKSPLAEYAGAWLGTFQGHAWMSIRLALQANQVSGNLILPKDLKFNDQGDIKSVSDEKVSGTVENAVLNGDGLLLTVKVAGDKPETNQYLMRLTSASTAEVKQVAMSMPPGMPKPKPYKLSRVGASALAPIK
jgi:hypothetical protein